MTYFSTWPRVCVNAYSVMFILMVTDLKREILNLMPCLLVINCLKYLLLEILFSSICNRSKKEQVCVNPRKISPMILAKG